MIIYKDKKYNFIEIFNPINGAFLRSNCLDEKGFETKIEPNKRSYPELIDIGIMGHCQNRLTCKNSGIHCYQGYEEEKNMLFDDFKSIIDQSKGKTFQVALGGRGDPNKHECFEKMLKYCRINGIVPNITTSGFNITDFEKKAIVKYCGAVAISLYSRIEDNEETNPECIQLIDFFNKNIITNVHYVISKGTIDDAIYRLEKDLFPKCNGVIFLLYKSVGNGKSENVISFDSKLIHFFDLVFKKSYPFRIGFDSCFTFLLNKYSSDLLEKRSIQKCESGKFSCYISSDFKLYPCSFCQLDAFCVNLRTTSIECGWNSEQFKHFTLLNCNDDSICPLKHNVSN